jgi:hypothetical protein
MRKPTLDEIVSRGWTLTVWDSTPVAGEDSKRRWIWTLHMTPPGPDREWMGARVWNMGFDRLVMMRAEKGEERIEVGATIWKHAEEDLRDEMAGRI